MFQTRGGRVDAVPRALEEQAVVLLGEDDLLDVPPIPRLRKFLAHAARDALAALVAAPFKTRQALRALGCGR